MLKRSFDILVSFSLIVLSIPLLVTIALLIKLQRKKNTHGILASKGPIIFWSSRVGKNNNIFSMPKFRTMYTGTPDVATNKLNNQGAYITPLGSFLRKTSLDEIPQLLSILIGHMSLVGPRPALHNQHRLIDLRTQSDIHLLLPGVTGWAQVNGRDNISTDQKVSLDLDYKNKKTFFFDLKIIFMTINKIIHGVDIKH